MESLAELLEEVDSPGEVYAPSSLAKVLHVVGTLHGTFKVCLCPLRSVFLAAIEQSICLGSDMRDSLIAAEGCFLLAACAAHSSPKACMFLRYSP